MVEASVTYISLETGFVAHLVQVVCGNTGLYLGSNNIQDFSRQLADLSHSLLCCAVEDIYLGSVEHALARGHARIGIVGLLNRLWDDTSRRERIHGPNRACVWEPKEWVIQAAAYNMLAVR